jgi:hypothetical protein
VDRAFGLGRTGGLFRDGRTVWLGSRAETEFDFELFLFLEEGGQDFLLGLGRGKALPIAHICDGFQKKIDNGKPVGVGAGVVRAGIPLQLLAQVVSLASGLFNHGTGDDKPDQAALQPTAYFSEQNFAFVEIRPGGPGLGLGETGQASAYRYFELVLPGSVLFLHKLLIIAGDTELVPAIEFREHPFDMGQLFEQGWITSELAFRTGLGWVEIGLITLWTVHTDLRIIATDSLRKFG